MSGGQVGAIASTSARLWRRELASVFGIRERTLLISVAVFGAAMVAFSAFLAWTLGAFVASVAPASATLTDQRSLLRLILAGLMTGTTVYFLVVCSSLPPRDRLSNVLVVLPVTRWRSAVGTLLPAMGFGLAVAIVFGFPTLPMLVELVDPTRFRIESVGAFLGMIVLTALLVPGLFFTVRDVLIRVTRMPLAYSLALAVGVTLLAVFAVAGGDLIPRPSIDGDDLWSLLLLPRAMSEVLQPEASDATRQLVAWGAVALWSLLAVGLVVAVLRSTVMLDGRVYASPSVRIPERGSSWTGALLFEVAVLTRLPQFVVSSLVLGLSTVALPLMFLQPEASAAVDQVVALPVVVAFALGAYSYGSTRRSHWCGAVLGRPRLWVVSKLVACFLVSAVMAAPYLVMMALAGLPGERLLDVAMLGLGMWCSAALAGVLVPFSVDQPLSATVTSATTAGLWTLSTFGTRWVFAEAKIESPVLPALVWLFLALGMYVLVTSRSGERVDAGA
ncbi:hypothetical protein [Microbacterium sp. NPDC057944]|uniref:hypothetical protein n=1 Tax=Microbacterium sp. NPDC057944 TaxID=3346286 RepID=UPI0036D8D87B